MPLFQDNLSPYLTAVEQGSTPANPASGNQKLFIRTSDHVLCYLNSSGTVTPLTGFANPMTTKGDVILGDTGGAATRLGAGTSAYVLTSNGAAAFPSWQAVAAGGSPAAAGTLVQSIAWTTVASGGTKTFGAGPTNGNTIYAFIVTNSATVTSLGQTNVVWTRVGQTVNHSGNIGVTEIWRGVVSGSAGTVVTFTFSSNNVQGVLLQEWSSLTTVDAAEGWVINNGYASQSAVTFAWGTLGGRAFLVGQNSTGSAWVDPPGWTPSTGTPFNYGGSGEGYVYTLDASGGSGKTAQMAQIVPVNTDNHEATFMHCTP